MAKAKNNLEDYGFPILLPPSPVRFAYLDKPDEYAGKTTYYVEVYIDDSPEWAKILEDLKTFQDERLVANGRSTKPDLILAKTKDGKRYVRIASQSRDKFTVVDASKNPYDGAVFRDSIVQVYATPHFYAGFGGGVNLYLKAVQVQKDAKQSYTRTTAYDPFPTLGAPTSPATAVDDPFKGL